MRDDQLIQDLAQVPAIEKYRDSLETHQISTYSQLFAALADEFAPLELRRGACWILFCVNKTLDKRRAIPPLLRALRSEHEQLRADAARALGQLGSRRAVPELMALAVDKTQPDLVRTEALNALEMSLDDRAVAVFRQIMLDAEESINLRSLAIEWYPAKFYPLDDFIALLSHPSPDLRFWAAYRLALPYCENADVTAALPILDRIVAYDHTLPEYWGWHVDREAMAALENLYWGSPVCDVDGKNCWVHVDSYLISPAPEYDAFVYHFRQWTEDGIYGTATPPPVTLNVNPLWLEEKLRQSWPGIELNVRQPRPHSYLLDWRLLLDTAQLMGGLHRDQYAVVLSGDADTVFTFAAWYRGLFPAQQPLYIYEWAGLEVELKLGMTAAEITEAVSSRYAKPMIMAKWIE